MSEVTFRIIENYEPTVDYEEFKKDFLNPDMSVKEMKEKYGLSLKRWNNYHKRVCDECGIVRKPRNNNFYRVFRNSFPARVVPVKNGHEYIQEKNGRYLVVKTTGNKTYYFGRYSTLDCAMKVRDKMVKCNWDYKTGKLLAMKYGMERVKPAKVKALRMYDEFEENYIYSNHKITEIQEMMGLTSAMYGYLIRELKDKHGNFSRNELRKLHGAEPIKHNGGW